MNAFTAMTIGVLVGTGVYVALRGSIVDLVAGTLTLSNAAILFLLASGLGAREEPVLPVDDVGAVADPLVQAFAVTAVVIGFGVTALLLRIGLAVTRTHDTLEVGVLTDAPAHDEAPSAPLIGSEERS